jgi:hypothetical protein
MLNILFWIAVGVFIGWNLPQPAWAKQMQDRVANLFNELTSKRG